MTSSNCENFLIQFRTIGQSLKKRFFRKPNVADAIDQYESLCQELQRDQQKEFAAICSLEQAKCYESVQNSTGQTNSLMRASRYMIDAYNDYKNFDIDDKNVPYGNKMGGRADGFVQVAVQALEQCVKTYTGLGNNGLVVLVNMKIGQILFNNNYFDQALKYYEEALKITEKNFTLPDQLVIVEKVVDCKVKISELESASQIVSEYLAKVTEVRSQYDTVLFDLFIQRFQITKVCLLLILGCDSADIVGFIWPEETGDDDDSPPNPESSLPDDLIEAAEKNSKSEEIILCLKSLALAVQHGSMGEIHIVQNQLASVLTDTHRELFRTLLQIHS